MNTFCYISLEEKFEISITLRSSCPKHYLPTGQCINAIMASEVLSYNMFYGFNPDISSNSQEHIHADSIIDEADDYMAQLEWEEYMTAFYKHKMRIIEMLCECYECSDISTIVYKEEQDEEKIEKEKAEEYEESKYEVEADDRMTSEELEEAFDNYDIYCCALD